MKQFKKVILLCAIVFSMFSSSIVVKAEMNNGNNIGESKFTQQNMAEAISNDLTKGKYLNEGMARISNNGNGSVNVYGAVIGSVICDKMILELTLQRYVNGSWINVKSFSNTAYNTSLLTKSYNVSVTKGYYYRVKAACVAQENGASESKMPVTDGIWIN